MKTARRKYVIPLILMSVCTWAGTEDIIQIPDQTQSLKDRWNAAFQQKEALDQPGWIGYSIGVQTESNIHFRHGHGNRLTLEGSLSDQTSVDDIRVQNAAKAALNQQHDTLSGKERKNMGILFRLDETGQQVRDCRGIRILDFDSDCDLNGSSLIWMGRVEQEESLAFLIGLFNNLEDIEYKEDLVAAVAFHQEADETVPFLKKVVKSKAHDEIRESAVFWLSQQKGSRVLGFLVDVAHHDRAEDIREHAVFAISQVNGEEAEEALIRLAKKGGDPEVRKKAVFWLGQKASEKAARFLKDIVKDDPDTDVREHAVFALSQMGTRESLNALIKIAKTHPNGEVRKKAIFWLGQSDDPEAVDFLIRLVRDL